MIFLDDILYLYIGLGKITNVAFGCVAMAIVLLAWLLLRFQFRIPQSTADNPDESLDTEKEIKKVDVATA